MSTSYSGHGDTIQNEIGSASRKKFVLAFVLLLAAQLVLFYDTYFSMVQIWYRSETFAHGFFIFPISLYLIWSKRADISRLAFQNDMRALVILAGLGFGWLLANLVDVLVIQQFAVVAMLPVLVWAVFGLRLIFTILFPLAFMLFAVPVGEFLIYPMMEFTASFTVRAIRMTGIPVYWEGMFFTLPSGRWSIVEGCSGVRYIIASVTLGTLYAYLTYRSYWRRAIFIALAIIFPIVANGLRAYMIVMIGHFSNMKLATGVDHLVYGWVWFGIVMFIMFWIGSCWRDEAAEEQATPVPAQKDQNKFNLKLILPLALLTIIIWPVWASIAKSGAPTLDFDLEAPAFINNSQIQETLFTNWRPRYLTPSQLQHVAYSDGDQPVGLYMAYYADQEQGAELINSQNVLIEQKHPEWAMPFKSSREILVAGRLTKINESQLKSANQRLLVWQWNVINGESTINEYYGKVLEAISQLAGKGRQGTAVIVYTQMTEGELDTARSRLLGFTNGLNSLIE